MTTKPIVEMSDAEFAACDDLAEEVRDDCNRNVGMSQQVLKVPVLTTDDQSPVPDVRGLHLVTGFKGTATSTTN